MKSIKVNNLSFSYNEDGNLFKNTSIDLPFEKVTLLKGKNGSGKTTLCRLISGLERNYTGTINIDDLNLKPISFAERSKFIIYIKQEPLSNIVAATPEEDLILWQHGFDKKNVTSTFEHRNLIMEKFKIAHLKNKPFWELSGGQIKRVGLAALLLNYDKYWILDEPISGLDNKLAEIFIEILKERKKLGHGCLIVSHKEDHFLNLTDKAYEIENGKFNVI